MPSRTFYYLIALAVSPVGTLAGQAAAPDSAQVLYGQLREHFQTSNIQVRIGALGPKWVAQITFDDSTFFRLSRADRLQAAQAVAEYVRDYYGPNSRLTDIVVMWSSKGTDGAIESFMRPFAVGDLGPRPQQLRSQ